MAPRATKAAAAAKRAAGGDAGGDAEAAAAPAAAPAAAAAPKPPAAKRSKRAPAADADAAAAPAAAADIAAPARAPSEAAAPAPAAASRRGKRAAGAAAAAPLEDELAEAGGQGEGEGAETAKPPAPAKGKGRAKPPKAGAAPAAAAAAGAEAAAGSGGGGGSGGEAGPPHYLMKSEPEEFSIDDLAAKPDQTSHWEGVRNAQARNIMRSMRLGQEALFYHSSCKVPAAVGVVRVVREAYPDHFAFQKGSKYFDASSTPDKPKWWMVDVQLVRRLARPVTLAELRAEGAGGGPIAGMVLINKSRLSVQPVTSEQWARVLELEKQAPQ